MEKSKVYFTDFRARPGYNLLQKLEKLMKKAIPHCLELSENYYTYLTKNEPLSHDFLAHYSAQEGWENIPVLSYEKEKEYDI